MRQDLCDLQYSLGRIEPCPGDSCAFWGNGSWALASLRADLAENPDLARFMLGLRAQIEGEPELALAHLPGLND